MEMGWALVITYQYGNSQLASRVSTSMCMGGDVKIEGAWFSCCGEGKWGHEHIMWTWKVVYGLLIHLSYHCLQGP